MEALRYCHDNNVIHRDVKVSSVTHSTTETPAVVTLGPVSDESAFYCKSQLCTAICIVCLMIKVTGVATGDMRAALRALLLIVALFSLLALEALLFLQTSMSRLAAPLRVLIVRLMSTIDSKRISHLTQATNTNRADGADLNQAADPYTSV